MLINALINHTVMIPFQIILVYMFPPSPHFLVEYTRSPSSWTSPVTKRVLLITYFWLWIYHRHPLIVQFYFLFSFLFSIYLDLQLLIA